MRRTPATRARGWDRLVPAAILVALGLLCAGLTLPVMTVERFFVFSSQFSILQSLDALWRADEYFLFAAVALFSVAFPVAKLGTCLVIWYRTDARDVRFAALIAWVEQLGRWSMLDVFLVAILLILIRSGGVGARTEIGLYLFAAAVVASMFAAQWFRAAVRRLAR
jgi:paraquat-inducible protein A